MTERRKKEFEWLRRKQDKSRANNRKDNMCNEYVIKIEKGVKNEKERKERRKRKLNAEDGEKRERKG